MDITVSKENKVLKGHYENTVIFYLCTSRSPLYRSLGSKKKRNLSFLLSYYITILKQKRFVSSQMFFTSRQTCCASSQMFLYLTKCEDFVQIFSRSRLNVLIDPKCSISRHNNPVLLINRSKTIDLDQKSVSIQKFWFNIEDFFIKAKRFELVQIFYILMERSDLDRKLCISKWNDLIQSKILLVFMFMCMEM